jgi:hypothetical protein
VDQSEFGTLDLARAKPATKLPDAFHDAEQAARSACMSVRQHSAMGVDRQLSADRGSAVGKEAPPSPGSQNPRSSSSISGTMEKQS